MKQMIYAIFCIVGLFGTVHANESNETTFAKVYVSPQQVHFMQGEILVNVNDLWLRTNSISVDAGGYYLESFQPTDESSFSWECSVCGKRNEAYREVCKKCGTPR